MVTLNITVLVTPNHVSHVTRTRSVRTDCRTNLVRPSQNDSNYIKIIFGRSESDPFLKTLCKLGLQNAVRVRSPLIAAISSEVVQALSLYDAYSLYFIDYFMMFVSYENTYSQIPLRNVFSSSVRRLPVVLDCG